MHIEITVKLTGKKNTYFVKVGYKIIGLVLETADGFAAKGVKDTNWEGAFLFSSPENAALYMAHAERYIGYDDMSEKPDWDRYVND